MRGESPRSVQVACAVFRDAAGRVFAARRPMHKSLGGLWEFPGGKVEPAETPWDALVREIREELDVYPADGRPLSTASYRYDFGSVTLHPFLCAPPSGPIRLTEHIDSRWVLPAEFETLDWAPADAPVLAELRTL